MHQGRHASRAPVLPPTDPKLADPDARPYFLWWTDLTVADIDLFVHDAQAHRRACVHLSNAVREPDIEEPPPPIDGIIVESLSDLRAAKLTCLLSRSEPRDLVDLSSSSALAFGPRTTSRSHCRRTRVWIPESSRGCCETSPWSHCRRCSYRSPWKSCARTETSCASGFDGSRYRSGRSSAAPTEPAAPRGPTVRNASSLTPSRRLRSPSL